MSRGEFEPKKMRVALVHDYLKEFGGAERVLEVLHEIWPQSPVFVAMLDKKGMGKFWSRFADWDIRTSWFHKIPKASRLASPLRFLTPFIWQSFNFSDYDLVITSASWYITKGIRKGKKTKEICYCHTPPRFLYNYASSRLWQRYKLVRIYATIVNHFLRLYDYWAAQRVDYFIANSQEVAGRIKKFYRREAIVIHPPVEIPEAADSSTSAFPNPSGLGSSTRRVFPAEVSSAAADDKGYFLTGGRLVAYKNFDLVIKACNKLRVPLVVYGDGPLRLFLESIAGPKTKFVGRVSEQELGQLYQGCQAFIAAAKDEEFGITLVEAVAYGKPVIAFRGGGYLDIVKEGRTGVFFNEPTVEGVIRGIREIREIGEKIKPEDCRKQAKKFGKTRFKRKIQAFVKAKCRII